MATPRYTLRTCYFDEPTIVDEYDDREEAFGAWEDAVWAVVHAPTSQVGDVRSVVLKSGDTVLRFKSWL